MLRMIRQNIESLKYPGYAALSLSFASFGDAFLYVFLPQYASVMEIPAIWIGVLLSVNRFIRIIFNPVVVWLFAKFGARNITILASLTAVLSTIGYGLGWGLLSLILFRIIWGMSFAVLRMSTLAYALEQENMGFSLGVSKSIQECGPMLALWLGPMLLNYFAPADTFIFLALASLPSLFYALALPQLNYVPAPGKAINIRFPSILNSLTFVSSFFIEGILIIVIGLLLARNNMMASDLQIMILAGGLLAYRRVSFILFAPMAGAIADRIGLSSVFNFSLTVTIIGLVCVLIGWVNLGLVLIFAFQSINTTIAPGYAALQTEDKIRAVSVNATWRDIGAATGTLTGGWLLLSGSLLSETLLIATFILIILSVMHFRKSNRQ